MSIRVECEKCGGRFVAKDEHRGKSTKCPQCGDVIAIPLVADGDSGVAEIGDLIDQWAPSDRAALARAEALASDSSVNLANASPPPDAPPCPACKRPLGSNAAQCIYCELSVHSDKPNKPDDEFPTDRKRLKRCKICKRKSRYATKRADGLCRDCAKSTSGDPLADIEPPHPHNHHHSEPDAPTEKVNLWYFIVPLALVGVVLLVMSLQGMSLRLQGPTPPAEYADSYVYAPGSPIGEDDRQYLVKDAPSVLLTINMGQHKAVTNSNNQVCWGYDDPEVTLSGGRTETLVPEVNGTRGAWWGFRVNAQGEKSFVPQLSTPLRNLGADPIDVTARVTVSYAAKAWSLGSEAQHADKRETLERRFQIVAVSKEDYDLVARYRQMAAEYEGRGWPADIGLLLGGLALIAGAAVWGVFVLRSEMK